MYYRRTLTEAQINQQLLGTVLTTPLWWVIILSGLAIVLAGAVSAVGFMVNQGLGVTGLRQRQGFRVRSTETLMPAGTQNAERIVDHDRADGRIGFNMAQAPSGQRDRVRHHRVDRFAHREARQSEDVARQIDRDQLARPVR